MSTRRPRNVNPTPRDPNRVTRAHPGPANPAPPTQALQNTARIQPAAASAAQQPQAAIQGSALPSNLQPPSVWQNTPGGVLAFLLNPHGNAEAHHVFISQFRREDWYRLKALNRVCGNLAWPDWDPLRDPVAQSSPGPGRYLQVKCGNNERTMLPVYSHIIPPEQNPPAILQQEWRYAQGPKYLCSLDQHDLLNGVILFSFDVRTHFIGIETTPDLHTGAPETGFVRLARSTIYDIWRV